MNESMPKSPKHKLSFTLSWKQICTDLSQERDCLSIILINRRRTARYSYICTSVFVALKDKWHINNTSWFAQIPALSLTRVWFAQCQFALRFDQKKFIFSLLFNITCMSSPGTKNKLLQVRAPFNTLRSLCMADEVMRNLKRCNEMKLDKNKTKKLCVHNSIDWKYCCWTSS